MQGDIQAVVDESIGALGLPDATEVRHKVEDIAAQQDNAVDIVDKAANEIDRQITRASSDAILSKEGQQRTNEQVEDTQISIEQVEEEGEAAQDDVVTQNVMKHMARQNTQIAGILGAIRTDALKSQVSSGLTNLNLTNISRTLDGQNQAHQKETVGQGFSNLRTAAEAKLF